MPRIVSRRGGAFQRIVIVLGLLLISVIAPLLFLVNQLGDFSTNSGQNDFIDEISSVSVISDSRILNALEQESGIVLKEPVRVIYEDETNSIAHVQTFLKEQHENKEKEQSEQKGNPGEYQKLSNQVSTELNAVVLPLEHQHQKAERFANNASQRQDQVKSELWRTQQKCARISQKIQLERQNNWKTVQDAHVRQIHDQLIRAKVYLNLASARNNADFIRELRQRVRDLQRALGEASKDTELSRRAPERMRSMEHTLCKANWLYGDCYAMLKKLRAMMHSTEEQLQVNKRQSTFLTRLAARSFPKGIHCLPMRLTNEYYTLAPREREFTNKGKLEDTSLYHHAIFSDNILGTAVVVNSTIFHAKEPEKHVFHIATDKLNYAAMRMWFLANPPGKATIEVQNIDKFTWFNSSYCPVLEQLESASVKEYSFRTHHMSPDGRSSSLKYQNPKYLSVLNHLRFYLPEVFPRLNKILFLDDDVVIQKDLTALWEMDLHGNVNGAVEICRETYRFDKYLNFSNNLILRNFDPNSCGWAYGMNIFDLEAWRKQDITGIYHKWQNLNKDGQLWMLGSLPPGLITFYNFTYALDKSWHVLGLGYNPSISRTEIEKGAVIHYSGNLKPWLEIGIANYKQYWTKYVNYDNIFLQQCNIGG